MSSITKKIKKLEDKVRQFKNNKKLAKESGAMRRAHKYDNLIGETKLRIKELEKEVPLESNERLRNIIEELRDDNESLRNEINELRDKIGEQNERIDRFIHPERYEEEEEEEEEEKTEKKECPWCHRMFKGTKGLKIHQRSCKQGGQQ